ncbi:hypothetical protein CDL15_Pgr010276 [Punica granatum]|uniref:Uncharacterized protein n=1 Tax=Punica granatum TaxID=22663 RepID=A0A218W1I9_PUNGR|nr:hypothetical protein CDL15_Pgr010276 [Punica granatum]
MMIRNRKMIRDRKMIRKKNGIKKRKVEAKEYKEVKEKCGEGPWQHFPYADDLTNMQVTPPGGIAFRPSPMRPSMMPHPRAPITKETIECVSAGTVQRNEFDVPNDELDVTKDEFDVPRNEFDVTSDELNETRDELNVTRDEFDYLIAVFYLHHIAAIP